MEQRRNDTNTAEAVRSNLTLPALPTQTPASASKPFSSGRTTDPLLSREYHNQNAPEEQSRTYLSYERKPKEKDRLYPSKSARFDGDYARLPTVASGRYKHENGNDFHDVEFLMEQLRQFKIMNTQLKEERIKMQTRMHRLEHELKKYTKVPFDAEEEDEKPKDFRPKPPPRPTTNTTKTFHSVTSTKRSTIPLSAEVKLLREAVVELQKSIISKSFPSREEIEDICNLILSRIPVVDHFQAELKVVNNSDGRKSPEPASSTPIASAIPAHLSNALAEATSDSRSGQGRTTRTPKIGMSNMRQRKSIALVFSSPSAFAFPQSQRMIIEETENQSNGFDNTLSREQAYLSSIDMETISWEAFQKWYLRQSSSNQMQIVQELFYMIKGSKKVFEVATQISFSHTVEEVVLRFKEGTKDVLGADEVHIYALDGESNLSSIDANIDNKPPSTRVGVGVIGRVAQTGVSMNIKDVSYDEDYNPETDNLPNIYVKSILAVPLADRYNSVFAIAAAYKQKDVFGKEDEILMQVLADQLSNNMQQFKLLMKTIRGEKINKAISDVLKVVNDENATFDQVIDTIIRVTYDVMEVDRVSFFLVDNIAKQLLLKVSKDNVTIRVPIGIGIAGTVAATGQTINIPDAYEDPRFDRSFDIKTGFRTRTILCVPIFDNNKRPIAVIQVLNKASGAFTGEDEQLLLTFTAEAAAVIQRQSLETAYHNIMASSDSSSANTIKDLLGEYSTTRKIAVNGATPRPDLFKLQRQMTFRILETANYTARLKDWDLDHFALSDDEMYNMIIAGFETLDLLSTFKIDQGLLRTFLRVIRSHYRDNPYHNFQHAFSVFQSSYIIITSTEAVQYLTPLDILGLMVAAICHDVDHPGTNNAFLMNSGSPLALVYNDISILENHHSSLTFRIINEKTTDIFSHLEPSDRFELRKTIIPAILATDMAEHSKLTTNLTVHNNKFQRDRKEDRQFLVNIILHSSDLCNPVLPTDRAYTWATRVLQEFNQQAKQEHALSLPVAAFMEKSDEISKANLNIGFIKYVVSPLWNRVVDVFPELKYCAERMEQNIKSWEAIIERNGASS